MKLNMAVMVLRLNPYSSELCFLCAYVVISAFIWQSCMDLTEAACRSTSSTTCAARAAALVAGPSVVAKAVAAHIVAAIAVAGPPVVAMAVSALAFTAWPCGH